MRPSAAPSHLGESGSLQILNQLPSLTTVLIEQPTVLVIARMDMPSTSSRRIMARFSVVSLFTRKV